MRYRNKRTGTIAEPSAEVAALNFAHNSNWEEVVEEVNAETDPPHEPETHEEDPSDESETHEEDPPDETETEGEEETECSPSEQTATLQSDMPMNISEDTTEQETPNGNAGKPSAKKKKKASSKPTVKN